jgi:two-component system, NtrC family, sensor kinase
VDHEVAGMKYRVLLVTGVEVDAHRPVHHLLHAPICGQPIEKLIEGTKAISQMELDKPLDIAGNSEELDELARSFDVMRDRLRTALARSTVHAELETKVEDRTQQLKAAHQKLLQSDRLASLGSFPPAWRTRSTIPSPAC